MTNLTIFTPTYNRIQTLGRVYQSLLKQTCKDFNWLIIDDGSTDNTKDLVEQWILENKIKIRYHFKENGGKHTAMKLAYELANTKFLLAIDSDDELTPDAIEIFQNEWEKIEEEGLQDTFAEVRAHFIRPDGSLIGNYIMPDEIKSLDSNWHEMVLKNRNNNELIVCWNLKKLIECVQIPDKFWLSDKVNFFGEATLWARIGLIYKTRYINKSLGIAHNDAGESLLRISDKTKGHYNNLVGNKYFLDENLNHFFWNPKYFFNLILKFIISGIELDYSPVFLIKSMKSFRFRFAFILLFPFGLAAWFYFKKVEKSFWF